MMCNAAGVSVQWGAWASIGMAAQNPSVLARIGRSGMGLIAPASGIITLYAVLKLADKFPAQIIANPFEWTKLLQGLPLTPAIFDEHSTSNFNKVSSSLLRGGLDHGPTDSRNAILEKIQKVVHEMLGSEVRSIPCDDSPRK